ncbi:hypothetical protein ABPG74_013435 [Tetrahymena malaccensis]
MLCQHFLQITSSSSTCTNKCNALSTTDCALPINFSNCDVVGTCAVSSTVCSGYTSKTDCQGQSACSWTEAVQASCSNKASIQSVCNQLGLGGCDGDSKCIYTSASFVSCTYITGQCPTKSESDCATFYCNLVPSTCKAKSLQACSNFSSIDCEGHPGCKPQNGQCVDSCSSKNASQCAADSSNCNLTQYSCTDKNGDDNCKNMNESLCPSAAYFCQTVTNPAACNADSNYCSSKNPTQCNSDANCIATPAVAGFCSNKATTSTCSGLVTQSTCSGNAGCAWNLTSCKNKEATSCQTTDNQASCTGSGKFCDYAEIGTCSASNSSSSTSSSNSQTSSNNSSTSGYSSSTSKSFSSILVISLIAIIDLI